MGIFISLMSGRGISLTQNEQKDKTLSKELLDKQISLIQRYPKAYLIMKESGNGLEDDEGIKELKTCIIRGVGLLQKVNNYKGSSEMIRKAITEPTAENEEAAWKHMLPMIKLLQECFELSCNIERQIPELFKRFFEQEQRIDLNETQKLAQNYAYEFAQIMDFSFRFDAAKILLKDIQNDLSYYRRIYSRMGHREIEGVERSEIPSGEVSNQMSLFYAYHSPMVRIITEQTQKYVNDENRNQFLLSLCILAAGSMKSIKDNSAPEVELNLLLRMLVTACILYDWVSIDGVFKSSSTIPILEVVSLIKKSTASPSIYLLPIQIASRDFNNPNIPVAIKNAFLA